MEEEQGEQEDDEREEGEEGSRDKWPLQCRVEATVRKSPRPLCCNAPCPILSLCTGVVHGDGVQWSAVLYSALQCCAVQLCAMQ